MNIHNTLKEDRLIVANCSGFLGDRFSAAREMVRGGPIDVLTGDYLAELTMALLFRKKMKDPDGGYASTFLRQTEEIMGECLDRNIRIVSNAGGLNPRALAEKLEHMASGLGLRPKIAYIEGDNLIDGLNELQDKGETFTHQDRGVTLKEEGVNTITANAYLGGWGIATALAKGADIVIGGRIADAALVTGPAAWKFGWKENDWDKLAGAAVAGHIIECGPQATGGNYPFIEEVPSFRNVGFPIAEVFGDGSSVITKHPGTGGLVSVGTVTAQLLYEIREPTYLTPDVAVRFDSINISQQGPDRVLIEGTKGSPPPPTTKACLNNLGGYRNGIVVVVTGLDVEAKARIVEDALFESLGGKNQFEKVDVQLIRSDKPDPETNEEACANLKLSVMDPDPGKVGRAFSSKAIELVCASIPGFTVTAPPGDATPAIRHWPTVISRDHIRQTVFIEREQVTIDPVRPDPKAPEPKPAELSIPAQPGGKTVSVPFGRAFGARSGDKGGNANLGVWARSPQAFAFLRDFLTTHSLKELLPDMNDYEIERYELPNLLALNFYIKGLLGDGVAASVRSDPQAKTLGEYLRAKVIDIPQVIVGTEERN
jgi:hypothetical protein